MNQKSFARAMAVVVAVGIAAPVALDARAKKMHLESHWRDRPITIDGDSGDWQGPFVSLDEKHPVAIGAANDGEYLYVVLTASEQAVRMQIMREGLIVWFDPAGGDKKHFGIKFPVGMDFSAGRGGYGRSRSGGERDRPRPAGDDPAGQDPSQAAPRVEPPNRLEVLGPGKDDVRSFTRDRAPGIEVQVAQSEGTLVYELKVPLAATSELPYAIGSKPGAEIGIGLETPKRETPQGRSSFGGPGGGGFGGGGGRGGFGGGRRGGGMGRGGGGGERREGAEMPKPMKDWAVLQLAAH